MANSRMKPFRATPSPPSSFIAKNGVDLMAGPKIKTIPVCPPKYLPFVPQLGLNMGFDKRP
jgi:hypothetical protein